LGSKFDPKPPLFGREWEEIRVSADGSQKRKWEREEKYFRTYMKW
jgi:hypothetical protein